MTRVVTFLMQTGTYPDGFTFIEWKRDEDVAIFEVDYKLAGVDPRALMQLIAELGGHIHSD